jgi:hypothetical protein
MNPRVTAIVAGLIMIALGTAGLLYPERVLGLLGFTVFNASHAAAAYGEVRATYGGLFLVMGVFTLMAAMDPAANRARLLFVGLLWLGACAGRLFGVFVDGNPGLFGWLAIVFELAVGGALCLASQSVPEPVVRTTVTTPRYDQPGITTAPPVPPV